MDDTFIRFLDWYFEGTWFWALLWFCLGVLFSRFILKW